MNTIAKLIIGFIIFNVITGFNSAQPQDERQTQDSLPQITNGLWQILAKNRASVNGIGLYHIVLTDETKKLDGADVTVKGFVLPLDPTEKFTHFILSTRTPTCYFCPPGGPTEIIDVTVDKPIAWDEDSITVKGKFGFMKNEQLGMFFKIEHASLVK